MKPPEKFIQLQLLGSDPLRFGALSYIAFFAHMQRSVLSLPKLPFRSEGGVPGFLSADALDVNYNKFHFQWVKRTNELIHGTPTNECWVLQTA
jgi:hypothetical protein